MNAFKALLLCISLYSPIKPYDVKAFMEVYRTPILITTIGVATTTAATIGYVIYKKRAAKKNDAFTAGTMKVDVNKK